MSERYKPRDLYRRSAALWADPNYGAAIREREEQRIRERLDAYRPTKLAGSPRVVECRHGVSWLTCDLCSTRKA